jgi:hypothetical protein
MFKLDYFKKKIYFMKYVSLFNKGLRDGRIVKFDEDIYNEMDNTIIAAFPVSFYIKHSKHMFPDGTCYERSLYMFLALNDALLVRGGSKYLEYTYGKGHEGHGWIERGNYVYDPSLMLRFDKDIYYSLYECSNVTKINKNDYLLENKDFVDSHVSTCLEDFLPGGNRRVDLGTLVYQIKVLSELTGDIQFIYDLNSYLDKIKYDDDEINEERNNFMKRVLSDKDKMVRISGNIND